MPEDHLFTQLLDAVRSRLVAGQRLFVGIAGPPGAGKSTLALEVAAALDHAVMVPMDGYHLANAELVRLGRAGRKGAPDTFDSAGYVALLRRLRDCPNETVYAPTFDHVMNEPIAGSIPVPPDTQVIVTEGNYLLHWPDARAALDLTAYVDADPSVRVAGLIARQMGKGLSPAAAHDWVMRSDEANARLIAENAHLANLQLYRP
jgi:pantothenate kinase